MGRKLTDSEVFGFSQVNSNTAVTRYLMVNLSSTVKKRNSFQLIKRTSQVNPNLLISAYKDNVASGGPVIKHCSSKVINLIIIEPQRWKVFFTRRDTTSHQNHSMGLQPELEGKYETDLPWKRFSSRCRYCYLYDLLPSFGRGSRMGTNDFTA